MGSDREVGAVRPRASRRTPAASVADAARRGALLVVIAALVVLSPTVAWATFNGTGHGAVSIGTTTLAAPSTMSIVTAPCPNKNKAGNIQVTFPNAALADSYTVVLQPGTGASTTRTVLSGTLGTIFVIAKGESGTYGVTVTSVRGNWTSQPLTQSFTC